MKQLRLLCLVALLALVGVSLAVRATAADERAADDARAALDESLIASVGRGETDKVRELLAKGANPNAANEIGMTALQYAARSGHLKIMKQLISKGADVNSKDEHGRTPLLEAASFVRPGGAENATAVKLLLAAGAKPEGRVLAAAAAVGSQETVNLLLAAEVHPDAGIAGAARAGGLGLVKHFLAKGASVNAKNERGVTPLHAAASGPHIEVARFLIERGADLNARTDQGKTPLHSAASRDGDIAMVRLLIEAGAVANIPDNEGVTPIRHAAIDGEPAIYHELLKANGGVETVAPGFLDDGSRPTAELIADLAPRDAGVRKAAERALVARGEEIMPEVLRAMDSAANIGPFVELFIKMGPGAEAALPEIESRFDDPKLAFWMVIKMNQMKPGHFASLPQQAQDRAAAAIYEFIVDPKSEPMTAGMLLEMFPRTIGEASAPYLLKLLRSDNAQHRADAADGLSVSTFATDELRTQLVKLLLEDPDPTQTQNRHDRIVLLKVRPEAAGALGNPQFHAPEAKAALISVLETAPPSAEKLPGEPNSSEYEAAFDKQKAVSDLLDRAAHSLASYGPGIIDEFLPRIRTGGDPNWKRFRQAWGYLGADSVPHFERLLNHEDERVRNIAFEELGRLANESPEAIEMLLDRIGSDDPATKRMATEALLKLNRRAGKAVLSTLYALMDDADIPIRTRLIAVRTALKIDGTLTKNSEEVKQFLPQMIAAAEEGEYYTRFIALEALGELGRAAEPVLARIEALTQLEFPKVPPAKEPLIIQDGRIVNEDPARHKLVIEHSKVGNIRRAAEDAQRRIEEGLREAKL